MRAALVALSTLVLVAGACARPAAEAPANPPAASGTAPGPAAAPAAPAQPSRPRETITFAVPQKSLNYIQPIAAAKLGFFDEAGLDVKIEPMQANLTVAALHRGDLQISGAGGSAVRAAVQGGAPFKVVAFHTVYPTWYVLTNPEIRTPAQLANKRIGVSQVGTSQHFAMEILARERGVDPKLITFVAIGTDPAQLLAATHAGAIDGFTSDPGTAALAEKQGLHMLESLGDVIKQPLGGIVATDAYAQNNSASLRAFLKGFVRGLLYTKQNQRETAAIARQELSLDMDEATSLRAVQLLADAISGQAPGYADEKLMETFYEYDVRLAMELPPDQRIPVLHDFRWLLEAYDDLGIPRPR
jgi:ABC-type nitrate/sulfonate/bicarbonate transport system substrate-binding protein